MGAVASAGVVGEITPEGCILCPSGTEAAWRASVWEVPLEDRFLLCGLACRAVERRCVELGEQELPPDGEEVERISARAEETISSPKPKRRLPALALEDVLKNDGQGADQYQRIPSGPLTPAPLAPVLLGSPVPHAASVDVPWPPAGRSPCGSPAGAEDIESPRRSDASARTSISLTSSAEGNAISSKGSPASRRNKSARELGMPASPQRSAWSRGPSSPKVMYSRPDFGGVWTCRSTWGLDGFLGAMGVSRLHRVAVEQAPWPWWEFQQDGNCIVFVNHSFLGDLREEFEVGGPEYEAMDCRGQASRCRAFWEDGVLVVERNGPQGRFREERLIGEDGVMRFTLRSVEEGRGADGGGRCFGRAFERWRPRQLFC